MFTLLPSPFLLRPDRSTHRPRVWFAAVDNPLRVTQRRRMKTRLRPFVALVALPFAAGAQMKSVVTPDRVRFVLSSLAHDSMEGRGTGTPGSMRAAKFIADQFRLAGLTPAGDSGYFQHVPMFTRSVDPKSSITVDGTTLRLGVDFSVAAGPCRHAPTRRSSGDLRRHSRRHVERAHRRSGARQARHLQRGANGSGSTWWNGCGRRWWTAAPAPASCRDNPSARCAITTCTAAVAVVAVRDVAVFRMADRWRSRGHRDHRR